MFSSQFQVVIHFFLEVRKAGLEATDDIVSTVKSREEWVHACLALS